MNSGKLWQLEKVLENPQESELCVLGLQAGASNESGLQAEVAERAPEGCRGSMGPSAYQLGVGARVDAMEGRRDTNHGCLLPSTSYEPGSFLRTLHMSAHLNIPLTILLLIPFYREDN